MPPTVNKARICADTAAARNWVAANAPASQTKLVALAGAGLAAPLAKGLFGGVPRMPGPVAGTPNQCIGPQNTMWPNEKTMKAPRQPCADASACVSGQNTVLANPPTRVSKVSARR